MGSRLRVLKGWVLGSSLIHQGPVVTPTIDPMLRGLTSTIQVCGVKVSKSVIPLVLQFMSVCKIMYVFFVFVVDIPQSRDVEIKVSYCDLSLRSTVYRVHHPARRWLLSRDGESVYPYECFFRRQLGIPSFQFSGHELTLISLLTLYRNTSRRCSIPPPTLDGYRREVVERIGKDDVLLNVPWNGSESNMTSVKTRVYIRYFCTNHTSTRSNSPSTSSRRGDLWRRSRVSNPS